MSNKETLQTNNEILIGNNEEIDNLMTVIENLPSAALKPNSFTPGNLTMFDNNGNLLDAGVVPGEGGGGDISSETAGIIEGDTPAVDSVVQEAIDAHANNKNNPHGVTAEQVGATKSFGVIPDTNLLTWMSSQIVGGSFIVDPSITAEGVPLNRWFSGEFTKDGEAHLTDSITGEKYYNRTRAGVWQDWDEDFTKSNPPTAADVGAVNPNLLDNGDFQVWQRGTSFTVTAGYTYTADRFRIFTQSSADVEKDGDSIKVVPKGEGVNSVSVVLEAHPEWLGKTMTLSFEAKATSEIADIQAIAWNGDNYTNPIKYLYYTVGTEFNRFTLTFTVPATLTDNKLHFWINRVGAKTLWLRKCKLELGDVATPFYPRSYGEELARCQRYFYRFKKTISNQADHLAYGNALTTTTAVLYRNFPVPMRTKPSAIVNASYGGLYLYDTKPISNISSVTNDVGGIHSFGIKVTVDSATLTAGNAMTLNCNSTNFYIDYSADL